MPTRRWRKLASSSETTFPALSTHRSPTALWHLRRRRSTLGEVVEKVEAATADHLRERTVTAVEVATVVALEMMGSVAVEGEEGLVRAEGTSGATCRLVNGGVVRGRRTRDMVDMAEAEDVGGVIEWTERALALLPIGCYRMAVEHQKLGESLARRLAICNMYYQNHRAAAVTSLALRVAITTAESKSTREHSLVELHDNRPLSREKKRETDLHVVIVEMKGQMRPIVDAIDITAMWPVQEFIAVWARKLVIAFVYVLLLARPLCRRQTPVVMLFSAFH